MFLLMAIATYVLARNLILEVISIIMNFNYTLKNFSIIKLFIFGSPYLIFYIYKNKENFRNEKIKKSFKKFKNESNNFILRETMYNVSCCSYEIRTTYQNLEDKIFNKKEFDEVRILFNYAGEIRIIKSLLKICKLINNNKKLLENNDEKNKFLDTLHKINEVIDSEAEKYEMFLNNSSFKMKDSVNSILETVNFELDSVMELNKELKK